MDGATNAQMGEFCGVIKGVDERIDEDMERMENDMISKRVYVGKCAGSWSVGRLQKRWIDNVKEFLRKRGFNVKQARRMMGVRVEREGSGGGG